MVHLLPYHVVAAAFAHPETVLEAQLSHSNIVGFISENRHEKFCNRHIISYDNKTMNKYLADHCEQNMSKYGTPVTAEDIIIDVSGDKEFHVRVMSKNYEQVLPRLGKINVTEMRTDLIQDKKALKSQPVLRATKHSRVRAHRSRQSAQCWVSSIYSCQSGPPPHCLHRKKDGKLGLCIYYKKLISITVKNTYLLQWMYPCVDTVVEEKYFTTLGVYNVYWQMNIWKQNGQKTAFFWWERSSNPHEWLLD